MIIGASYRVNTNLIEAGRDLKEVDLALIGNDQQLDIAMTIDFKKEESSFLAGILAASMTESGTIGFIGAYKDEDVDYMVGYYAGAMTYNPDIKIISYYTESYNNISQGYKLANDLMNKNADVIFTNCGSICVGCK